MHSRTQTWLALIVVAVGLLLAAILGLWAYTSATATPLHPNPQDVPSVTAATPARVAVGLLLEKDRLDLDDEIQVYVPEFPKKQWPVTLRQLMAQVAGVRTDPGGEAPLSNTSSGDGNPARRCGRTVDGLHLENFADRELLFEPGTRYRPSSYGWILVSAALEAAANESFFAFMRTQVFEPLGMRDTTVDVATEAIPSRASFYFPIFGLAGDTRYGPKSARQGDYSCDAGAAAFLSTPSDLVRFGMGITSGKLLKPGSIRACRRRDGQHFVRRHEVDCAEHRASLRRAAAKRGAPLGAPNAELE
jgi:CubicO group peptidase (beta-lactamase class C family)